jgi:hypothetical protein
LPFLALGFQAYPEPFVTLLVTLALLAMADPLRGAGGMSPRAALALLAVCLSLPWFHPKFALLSAALAAMALAWGGPWTRRQLAGGAGFLLAGAAAFLAFHLPVFGDVLVKQNAPNPVPLRGLLGMLADSENGILAFIPWLVLLPAGAVALRKSTGTWRVAWAWACLFAPVYFVTAISSTWNDGGTSAVRYFEPLLVASAPLLAAALARTRGQLLAPALLVSIPACAAIVFLADPVSAFFTETQAGRSVLDRAIPGMSWRELFAHFPYRRYGSDVPGAIPHALAVVAVALAAGWWLTRRRTTPAQTATGFTIAVVVLAFASCATDSPNWTVTASRMFEAQTTRLGWLERHESKALRRSLERAGMNPETRPRARLVLPASLKPADVTGPGKRTVTAGGGLQFPPALPDNLVLACSAGKLPRGFYRVRTTGSAAAHDDAGLSATLGSSVQTCLREPPVTMCEMLAETTRTFTTRTAARTPVDWELVCPFEITEWPRDIGILFHKTGAAIIGIRSLELWYQGRDRP